MPRPLTKGSMAWHFLPYEFKASPLEKDLITTDRRELQELVERMRQKGAEGEPGS